MYVYLAYLPTTSIKIDILKTSINNDYTMQIYKNIKEIGIEKPIIVDETGRCLLGTTRVRAAIPRTADRMSKIHLEDALVRINDILDPK